ncbi:MAG: molybdopterin-guanine dinucleotide biosynthesis protein B [Gemmatimonadaceae bacterium]
MVAVIGKKHSGKTTLAVRLAAELHRRGYRVMTIKHGTHTFNLDPSTTDTFRHYHEGLADRVAMASPDKFALVSRWAEELSPEEIATRYMSDADIVICEGFKLSSIPKIEVYRTGAHAEPLYLEGSEHAARYIAIVTDSEAFNASVQVVRFSESDWLSSLADVVERRIMSSA